jgi:hypothetical protein
MVYEYGKVTHLLHLRIIERGLQLEENDMDYSHVGRADQGYSWKLWKLPLPAFYIFIQLTQDNFNIDEHMIFRNLRHSAGRYVLHVPA